ncbi:MAG: cupin domain-containing protein [Pseudomonadota bacterium]
MSTMKRWMSLCLVLCATVCFSASDVFVSHAQDASGEQNNVVTEVLLDNVTCSWDGKTLEAYLSGQPAITMLKITVPPKTRLKSHYHSVINVGYMLEGELTVIGENGLTKTIKAGEPLIEMVGTVHYGENKSDSPAVILVFYAGDTVTPITTAVD